MGVFKLVSSCDDKSHSRNRSNGPTQTEYVYIERISNNPDPTRFVIQKTERAGRFLIAEVHYPNCQNYEGNKILVFDGVTEKMLREQTSLHAVSVGQLARPRSRLLGPHLHRQVTETQACSIPANTYRHYQALFVPWNRCYPNCALPR